MQYFKAEELTGNKFQDADKSSYNRMLPHYQLGYALYNKDFDSFINFIDPQYRGIEVPHNTMHNNMHFAMIDGNFSLANLMFFPYHSWIDAQLEMKIRMCHNSE